MFLKSIFLDLLVAITFIFGCGH